MPPVKFNKDIDIALPFLFASHERTEYADLSNAVFAAHLVLVLFLRDKIMEYMNTEWLKRPGNLILIGPAGVGKTHIATAFCHDALSKSHQTVFLSLFDLTAKNGQSKEPL